MLNGHTLGCQFTDSKVKSILHVRHDKRFCWKVLLSSFHWNRSHLRILSTETFCGAKIVPLETAYAKHMDGLT